MFIKYAYVIFIGVLLATFVGVGIAAFYPEPKYPETPYLLKYPRPVMETPATQSAEEVKQQKEYERLSQEHQVKSKEYHKIVSMIALTAAVLILVLSLTVVKRFQVIADGMILGGVLTLCYSIIRGFNAQDDIFRFLVVTVGLVIAISLGYLKFIRPQKS
jgi:hypothetical protein